MGNAAEEVVNKKGVKNGLGWPGLTYVMSSRTFTDKFWELIIKDNYKVENAIEESLDHTKKTYFYNFGLWGDNTIMDPRLYKIDSTFESQLITFNTNHNINTEEMKFEDSKQIIYFTKIDKYFTNNFKIIDKEENEQIHDYNEESLINMYNETKKTKNNAQFIIEKSTIDEYVRQNYSNNYSYDIKLEQNYLINNLNNDVVKIKRIQILINNSILDEIYYDETNMRIIQEEVMSEYFNVKNYIYGGN